MQSDAPVEALGPFRVSIEKEREAAFRREIGLAEEDGVAAACFPAVWLTSPEIHDALANECAKADAVPVHESQSFSYVSPLRVGESYDLMVAFRRETVPARIIFDATVANLAGETCARIETMVRIVPRSALKLGPIE